MIFWIILYPFSIFFYFVTFDLLHVWQGCEAGNKKTFDLQQTLVGNAEKVILQMKPIHLVSDLLA